MSWRDRVLTHLRARQDIADQVDFYALHDLVPDVALRFIDALEEGLQLLVEHPEAGSTCTFASKRLVGLRQWAIPGFPKHLIFYRPVEGGIEVVRVLHGARDLPGLM